jgi:hypothetical protein
MEKDVSKWAFIVATHYLNTSKLPQLPLDLCTGHGRLLGSGGGGGGEDGRVEFYNKLRRDKTIRRGVYYMKTTSGFSS